MNFTQHISRGFIVTLISTAFAFCFNSVIATTTADAAQKTGQHEFKDPYKGGTRLSEGGGEPGKAYVALIDAVYKKDYSQICTLMTDGADLDECLKNKQMLKGIALMLGSPKGHKVLDGFLKGDEATLDVAYTWANMPDSYGFVVMKQVKGKWVISSFGGSGSTDVDVKASGTAEFGSPAK